MERYAIALKDQRRKMNDYRRTLADWRRSQPFSTETRSAISASGMPKILFLYTANMTLHLCFLRKKKL